MLTTSRTRRVVIDAEATNEPSTLGSRVSDARLLQLPKVSTPGALTLLLVLTVVVVLWSWYYMMQRVAGNRTDCGRRDIPDVRREALAGRGGLARENVVLQAAVKTSISRRGGHTDQGVEPASGERRGEDGEERRRAEDKNDSRTGWNYAEEVSAGTGGAKTGEASVPEEGATKGAWRWTGSIWRKVYLGNHATYSNINPPFLPMTGSGTDGGGGCSIGGEGQLESVGHPPCCRLSYTQGSTGGQPDADGNEERRNITWFERQTVQDRLDFNKYINCKDPPPVEVPSVDGLPLAKMQLPVNDFIVHQGNFERLRKGGDAGRAEQIQAPNLLPEDGESVLLRRRWGSCAVVGNSGALRLTQLARAIDSHDTVVRLNQAPTEGYMRRVGAKTTLRLLNKLWTRTYRNTAGMKRGSVLPVEDGVTFLVSRASSQEFELLSEFMRAYHPDVATLYLSSRAVSMSTPLLQGYRERLCSAGHGPFVGLNVPSSGYVAVYMLRRLCERVTVYGFGVRGMKGSKLDINTQDGFGYHYYRGVGSRAVGDDVHCFDCEEFLLKAMAAADLVDFCTFVPGNDTHNWACGCRHGDVQRCAPPSYPSWLRSTDDCDPTGMYDDCKDLKERRIDAAFQRSRLQLSGSGDALDADSSLSASGKASAIGGRPRRPHRS